MEKKTADYYDLPTEWIPSPNFAGRPASEIGGSMDGLWTFMESSSSYSLDTEDSPTPHVQSPIDITKPELGGLERPQIGVSAPIDNKIRTLGRSLSDDVKTPGRPRIRKKAATAPAGGVGQHSYTPQFPRRAVSAPLGLSNTVKGRNPRQQSVTGDSLVTEKSLHGPRTQLSRQPRPPRSPPPQNLSDKDQSLTEQHPSGSFSEKARVKKTLDNKNVERLKTGFVDFESEGLLSRPTSMLSTPKELYAIPKRGELPSPQSIQRDLVLDLSRTSALSALSILYGSYSPGNDDLGEEVGQTIYMPGAIRLEVHPAQLRRDSVASLDPFAKTLESKGKRLSDLIVVDGIALYFKDLGVVEDVAIDGLDRYWLDGADSVNDTLSEVHELRKPSIETVDAPVPDCSSKASSAQSSKFSSFSSDSSTSSRPQPETPMRQRDRLRRLLSPALIPGNWGQHS